MRDVEVDADHQSTATYINDMLLCLLEFLQLLYQVGTYDIGILHQFLLLEHIEHGQCCSAGQMITSEGGAQLSIHGLELWCNQHGSHRETIGDTLGHSDDVRTDVEPLVSEELTASSVATLYLVADQDGAVLLTGSSQTLGKLLRGEFDATHTLDALQDHSTDIAFRQFCLPGGQIVHRQIGHVAVVVDGGDDLRIVRHLYSQRGTSVESLLT